MKISVAQTRPVKGDITHNLDTHYRLIELGLAQDVDVIIFPELSVTGYEPELAASLAAHENDDMFDHLQDLSDKFGITIGVGMPKKLTEGISIGTVVIQPQQVRHIYCKKYLHDSEMPSFTSSENFTGLIGPQKDIALGICYEMSVDEHFNKISASGATYYMNSSVKDHESLGRTYKRLSEVSKRHGIITMVSNCVGMTGDYDCPGGSAIWDTEGTLLSKLNETHEGILIYDTASGQTEEKYL